MSNLDKIMKPKSIAVVGASTKEHTIGSDIMKRLQEYKFNGKIFPINPKAVLLKVYRHILPFWKSPVKSIWLLSL